MKAWSIKYEKCIDCGSSDILYGGKGKCKLCYGRIFSQRKRDALKGKEKNTFYKKLAERVRKWRNNNPLKVIAHRKVFVELRAGRLEKLPCKVCGDDRVHAHHADYNKPLDVQWLCPKHHGILSRK